MVLTWQVEALVAVGVAPPALYAAAGAAWTRRLLRRPVSPLVDVDAAVAYARDAVRLRWRRGRAQRASLHTQLPPLEWTLEARVPRAVLVGGGDSTLMLPRHHTLFAGIMDRRVALAFADTAHGH